MENYNGLKYRTRGNYSPQGKPRVFFCCQKEDFSVYFEPVTKEILDVQPNAAIWYYDPSEGIPEDDEFFADLSQMQLFVIPVTSRFLYKNNPARTVEFAYAVEHHIPVLPLMQETGLEKDFNILCGDLQFLDKNSLQKDPTALSYDYKLKKFIQSVLVSDELAQKIRDAFDAFIFLSYRKKDRQYAQQIMRLVHSNEFCRDIAIWYDEFLTPGENFNNAIAEALQKSSVFALVVTPNLLEKPNYIMEVEYPEAKRLDKPVLPIESVPTDSDVLAELYEGIDPALTPEQLTEKLHDTVKNIALRENDNDPVHVFMIGLAYLSGVDVEIDHERALQLITSAAEAGLPEAYKKLVSMYTKGEGVKRSYDIAVSWLKKYIEFLKFKYENHKCDDNLLDLIYELRDLAEYQWENKDLPSRNTYIEMQKYAEMLSADNENRRRLIIESYDRIGSWFCSVGEWERAEKWVQKALNMKLENQEVPRSAEYLKGLIGSYQLLSEIYETEKRADEAEELYQKSISLMQELLAKMDYVEAMQWHSYQYSNLGYNNEEEGNYADARQYYQKSLETLLLAMKEKDSFKLRDDVSNAYHQLGSLCEKEMNLSEAKEWFLKALEIDEGLAKETNSLTRQKELIDKYRELSNLCKSAGNRTEARDWLFKALEIRKLLAAELGTAHAYSELSTCYSYMTNQCIEYHEYSEAEQWFEKEIETAQKAADISNELKDQDELIKEYESYGRFHKSLHHYEKSKNCYTKVIGIQCATFDRRLRRYGIQEWFDLTKVYAILGDICILMNNYQEAKDWYEGALGIYEQRAGLVQPVRQQNDPIYSMLPIWPEVGNSKQSMAEACALYCKLSEMPFTSQKERTEYLDRLLKTGKTLCFRTKDPQYSKFVEIAEKGLGLPGNQS